MMRALENAGGLTEGSESAEIVRTLWVYNMHGSATYYNAHSTLTRTVHKTSNQYAELDSADLSKLISWF